MCVEKHLQNTLLTFLCVFLLLKTLWDKCLEKKAFVSETKEFVRHLSHLQSPGTECKAGLILRPTPFLGTWTSSRPPRTPPLTCCLRRVPITSIPRRRREGRPLWSLKRRSSPSSLTHRTEPIPGTRYGSHTQTPAGRRE